MHTAVQGCRRRPSDMCGKLENPHDVRGICRHGKGDDVGTLCVSNTISSASRLGTADGACGQAKYLPEASTFQLEPDTDPKLNIQHKYLKVSRG